MTDNAPILRSDEADRRMLLLTALHDALDGKSIHCVLARNHRLVLEKFKQETPIAPSGLTNPTLHVFLPDGLTAVTTDGVSYRLGKQEFPVGNPAAAAAAICEMQPARS